MVRLATAHRVTEDLDAVTWTEDGTPEAPIALLVEHGATRSRNGVDLGDVHIDLIAVSDYEPSQLPDERRRGDVRDHPRVRPRIGDLVDDRDVCTPPTTLRRERQRGSRRRPPSSP